MRAASLLGVSLPLVLTACTGMTLGENAPGADTYLGGGSIAVNDRTETSFVLSTDRDDTTGYPPQLLRAIAPDDGKVQTIADLSGHDDLRISFPSSGVLVMSEVNGNEQLRLLDELTFATKTLVSSEARYHGTRMAPSRDWIAVADNRYSPAPIHVLDADTLEARMIPHSGDWLEAMWLNQTDELMAIVFEDTTSTTPVARILSWNISDVRDAGFSTGSNGCWADPAIEVELSGKLPDMFFSFTWVGVSPDDRWAVFPVRDAESSAYELVVLDTLTSETRIVDNAKGPVGFTPDSATIVSYRDAGNGQELLLIDAATLEVDEEVVPIEGGVSYFVSHEGNFVIVGSSYGGQRLVLYDVDNDTQTQMDGPGVGLYEFVSRLGHGELWIVDSNELFVLDVLAGTFEQAPADFGPRHINILPQRDQLVLDDAKGTQIHFYDPERRAVARSVDLPPL